MFKPGDKVVAIRQDITLDAIGAGPRSRRSGFALTLGNIYTVWVSGKYFLFIEEKPFTDYQNECFIYACGLAVALYGGGDSDV